MSLRIAPDKPVQFGISSHKGIETLVTNGRITEFQVKVEPDEAWVNRWMPEFRYESALQPIWTTQRYFDTSGFQRIIEETQSIQNFSVMDGGAFGVNRGMRLELGTRECRRCKQYRYVFVYFYGESGNKLYRPMCLTCLESFIKRGEADVQP